jgi:predicted nucleic acid-binding protein
MRAVLDTNVVVSALIWGGRPFSLLQSTAVGDLLLCTLPMLLDELRDVLGRGHLIPRLGRVHSSVDQALTNNAGLTVCVTTRDSAKYLQA